MTYKKHFFFRHEGLLKKLDLDDVVYLEAAKNYTRLYTFNKTYMARVSLDAAMDLLPSEKFLRVHRSYAVATDHVDVVARDFVRFKNIELEVPVSRMYYTALSKHVIILDTAVIETEGKNAIKWRKKKS